MPLKVQLLAAMLRHGAIDLSLTPSIVIIPWNGAHPLISSCKLTHRDELEHISLFGPVGPWQAITLGIQLNRTREIRTINLLPADNLGYTYIPTAELCAIQGTNEYCGIGGVTDYPSNFTNTVHWANRDDFYVSGTVSTVMVNSVTQRASNVTVIPMTDATNTHMKYPTGDVPGAEIGFFFKGGSGSDSLCPEVGCDFTRSIYNSNQISSMSYGMHLGSVSMGQRGSLVLGGYDRSRIAGPLISAIRGSLNSYNTFDPNSFRLQDISIAVETGGSPFTFSNKTGLLAGEGTSSSQPVPVILDSSAAYIGLPEAAATAIASKLPVTDPSCAQIKTSAAYLGFSFTGVSSNEPSSVTIKVPFRLLNLTLEPRASGLETAVPYFPIRVLERSDYEFYNFGRAFLQAAFVAEDFSSNSTWMAQAPGPGGIDADIVDLEEGVGLTGADMDDEAFRDSWEGHWSPLYGDARTQQDGDDSDLSGGAKAGIVVGVLAGIGLVLTAIFFYFRRRRRSLQQHRLTTPEGDKVAPVELQDTARRVEIEGSETFEVATKLDAGQSSPEPQELPGSPAK
ncbi:hypothetical protein M409DRAFT_65994 [Zasmidium cellare ATCC 36951]|uniref:Peptidase A1 domain-containing protein n=1 Tax=Zasmidium cellare ATCC 36951 TaxID=1080233 RepID=A0A6A6CR56_ZASCE|nr:uncharacterized protein M409DRAFT_65994 [Zasmidium cellare ATCC 36951]KAF2167966.1 hypothetical protein M409DRAFT_65994 [Zasmidium cellare ATCC 36951]